MQFIDDIKENLIKKHQMDICNYKIDTDNNLVLFYDDNYTNDNSTYKYKNIIYDLKNEKPIASQYNQPITNNDNIKDFINHSLLDNKLSYSVSIEGTHLIVFYHNDKWFITTKKCLDANDSKWNGISYYEMFMNTIKNKFNLDDLDKNYCYHFNLININNYRNTKIDKSDIQLIFITEKETLKTIELDDNMKKIFNDDKKIINYSDKNELLKIIETYQNEINNNDDYNYQIKQIENKYDNIEERNEHIKQFEKSQNNIYLSSEGYNLIFYYKNDLTPIICKIQHPLYMYLSNHPVLRHYLNYPKYDIIYNKFILDTCERKKIKPILKKQVFIKEHNSTKGNFDLSNYDLSKDKEIINNLLKYLDQNRIHDALIKMHHNINNLSFLIKDIYFIFLKNNSLYEKLPDIYKTIKFLIHGVYLKEKENNLRNNNKTLGVTQNLIYNYLLTYEPDNIKELLLNYNDAVNILYEAGAKNTYRDINLPDKIYNKI